MRLLVTQEIVYEKGAKSRSREKQFYQLYEVAMGDLDAAFFLGRAADRLAQDLTVIQTLDKLTLSKEVLTAGTQLLREYLTAFNRGDQLAIRRFNQFTPPAVVDFEGQ